MAVPAALKDASAARLIAWKGKSRKQTENRPPQPKRKHQNGIHIYTLASIRHYLRGGGLAEGAQRLRLVPARMRAWYIRPDLGARHFPEPTKAGSQSSSNRTDKGLPVLR